MCVRWVSCAVRDLICYCSAGEPEPWTPSEEEEEEGEETEQEGEGSGPPASPPSLPSSLSGRRSSDVSDIPEKVRHPLTRDRPSLPGAVHPVNHPMDSEEVLPDTDRRAESAAGVAACTSKAITTRKAPSRRQTRDL